MSVFEYTTKDGTLKVMEHSSHYAIYHIPSGKSSGMGDGVDMFEELYPGTFAFNAMLARDLENSQSDYMEAYFPEEME